MAKVSFTVSGQPQGKGRPRFSKQRSGNVITRTPYNTVVYENLIRMQYQAQCGYRFPDDEMIDLRIRAYYQIPKSASKRRKDAMADGVIRPTTTPDVDNILKAVSDSLQGIAYRDDKSIVDAQIRKYYSLEPRLVITIQSV